jgi:uncharacterized protein YodC (DUF2158 family)
MNTPLEVKQMADDFKAGDTVELKSGSPTMTVEWVGLQNEYSETQGAMCSWFDKKNQPQDKWYPLTSLRKVNP